MGMKPRLAVDPAGFLYVADTYNQRVQKFDLNGNFQVPALRLFTAKEGL
jgi:hypothetical protein